jgi:hypothetical protein
MNSFEVTGNSKEEINRSMRAVAQAIKEVSGEGSSPDFKGKRLRNVGAPKDPSDAVRKSEHTDLERRVGSLETKMAQEQQQGLTEKRFTGVLQLSQAISSTPTQAEVQAVQAKVNELIAFLQGVFR